MAYVNGTTHYNLPQTVGTDKRDWTDTNQAFANIDSAIHTAVTTAETGATNIQALQTDVDALDTRVTSAEADITTNTTDIGLINTKVNTIDADIADVRQDAQDMICAYTEATATSSRAYAIDDYFIYNDVLYKVTAPIAIGGTIVPNTNCSATNVTTELKLAPTETTMSIPDNYPITEDITDVLTNGYSPANDGVFSVMVSVPASSYVNCKIGNTVVSSAYNGGSSPLNVSLVLSVKAEQTLVFEYNNAPTIVSIISILTA